MGERGWVGKWLGVCEPRWASVDGRAWVGGQVAGWVDG